MTINRDIDSLKNLHKKIVHFRDERDWSQFHTPKDLAISISIEASELLECFQWKSEKVVKEYLDSEKSKEIEEEIADVLIYLIGLSDVLGIDLIKTANDKLDKNASKYPASKAKGNAKKYTELAKE